MIPDKIPEYANGVTPEEWKLRLFVTDWTPRCTVAYKNLKQICSDYVKNKCDIEVVDLLEHPEVAKQEQIVTVPTLFKMSPKPARVLIGDFSNVDRVLKGLDVETVLHRETTGESEV
jgi:circadian clock protein KaiB